MNPPLIAFLFIFFTSSSYGQGNEQYLKCLTSVFNCGDTIQDIRYPFWGGARPRYCGLEEFELTCRDNDYATIDIDSQTFRVLDFYQPNPSMKIARDDLWNDVCPQEFSNTTLNHTPFSYLPGYENLTLFYDCADEIINTADRNTFNCSISGENRIRRRGSYAGVPFWRPEIQNVERCGINMTVPVLRDAVEEFRDNDTMGVRELVNWGFEVEYRIENNGNCLACEDSGGVCWINSTSLEDSTCLCPNGGVRPLVCSSSGETWNLKLKLGIGFGAAGLGILIVGIPFFLYHRRNKKRYGDSYFMSRNISSHPSSITDLEKAGTYLGVHIFSYDELEKATNKFDSNKELGDGGFGTVYKGKLRDGRVVAVKRLYENNYKRIGQFMNEVEILARLRHQNLVSLYGSTTHHCRELLLVYEYVPNGTVADHLHGELAKPGSLTWATRMSIAIETASALVYLHASDVIHRDVKTNNILLDNNFGVKVADFGLSRLFPTNVTHVSTAPQGTPGYVDPEYHQCYQLTNKSDVFSFGVVLIELISSKPAVDITRHRHEINLSNMAINKIQNHALHELVDPCLGFETDYKVRKMVRAVAELAFQCLQSGREIRPSMEEVLEELKGIQGKDYNIDKEEEVGVPADDVGLLKNNPQTLSPDTVSVKWLSTSTTSSSSIG